MSDTTNHEERSEFFYKDPFRGIDFWRQIDEEQIQVVEQGQVGGEGWARYEYYPRVGQMRVVKNIQNYGRVDRQTWTYNCRTSSGWGPHGSPDGEDDQFFADSIELLHLNGIETVTPAGYPEILQVIAKAKENGSVSVDALEQGKLYLFVCGSDMYVYKHDRIILQSPDTYQDIIRVYKMDDHRFGRRGFLELYRSGEPHEPLFDTEQIDYITISKHAAWSNDHEIDQVGIFELTENQANIVAQLKPPVFDQHVGTEWTRERVCIYAAMASLQYERWGKDEYGSDRRYEGVNRENYHAALRSIIGRFGTEVFAKEIEGVFMNHLKFLHTVKHLPNSPFKPHSDMTPLSQDLTKLAGQVIGHAHPLPEDMSESGHWVNAKSLFGDVDFWNMMRLDYPELFNRFVDYVARLPKQYEQHGMYASAIVDPVALIKQYFPEAYDEIVIARPDFNSDTPEAILIQPEEDD